MTSSRNASTSGADRVQDRQPLDRPLHRSARCTRSRAFARVRTLSAVSTTPSSTAMIGLTDSSVPIAAWAPLIRPPFLRYSSVSSATYMRMSGARPSRIAAISAAGPPLGGQLDAHQGEDPLGHRRALRIDDVDLAIRQHVPRRSGRS